MVLQRALTYGFLVLVILAPLPFGSVQTWASATLVAACLLLGVLWVVWRARRGLPSLPWKEPVLLAGLLFALFGVGQMIPLPRAALQTVSPKAVELRDRYEAPAAGPDAAAAPETATTASATRYTGWRPVSLYPWATRQATLRFLACLVAALIAIDLCSIRTARRALVAALLGIGAFEAIYGLAEFVSGRQHIFGYTKKYYTDVATGTFINRNHFAGYLEMTLPFAIALAATAISSMWPARGRSFGDRLARVSGRELFTTSLLLILALLMATALVCSRSRMGIISILVALGATGLMMAWRGRGRSFAVAACTVAAATLLVFGQSESGTPVVRRFLAVASEFSANLGRWEMWSQAVGMARAFPVMGAGLGVFGYVFPVFRTAGAGTSIGHAHNDYLELLAESGIVGFALVLLGAGMLAYSLMKARAGRPDYGYLGYAAACGVLAVAFHSITDFNLAIPSNALTLAVLIGVLACWRRPPVPVLAQREESAGGSARRAMPPAALMVAGALIAMAPVCADALDAGDAPRISLLIDGDNAARVFSASNATSKAALDDLQALVRATPDGPFSEATVRYIERRMEDAIALQSAGLRHLPTSFNAHIAMGHLRVGRCAADALRERPDTNCLADGMPQFRAALQLNPMSATTHAKVARLLITAWPLLGETERAEAARIIQRAKEMHPDDQGLFDEALAMLGPGGTP